MVSTAVFHVISTEMVVGSFAIAAFGTITCALASLVPVINKKMPSRLHSHLDSAAYVASIFGLLMVPLAIVTGYLTSESMGGQSGMSLNKMIFSGLCIGFWSGVISGRRLCPTWSRASAAACPPPIPRLPPPTTGARWESWH